MRAGLAFLRALGIMCGMPTSSMPSNFGARTPRPAQLKPGVTVALVEFGAPYDVRGTVDRYNPATDEVQVTHNQGGFDFWPRTSVRVVA